jgi:hypothetical protein
MVAPASRPVIRSGRVSRLWWLPAGGLGNGLDDDSWIPVLEISERIVPQVLSSLRLAQVPAYAAPAHSAAVALRAGSTVPPGYQLWVGGSAYGEAEAVLLAVMPSLANEAASVADTAWR